MSKRAKLGDYCGFSGSVTPLAKFPDVPRADAMLKAVAALVAPLMMANSFRVPSLVEFYPTNPGLQGMNMNFGQVISLRLRPAGNKGTFLSLDFVVDIVLHELTHCVFGPHDDKFYGLLDTLKLQFGRLRENGITGDRPSFSIGVWAPAGYSAAALLAMGQAAADPARYGGPGKQMGGNRLVVPGVSGGRGGVGATSTGPAAPSGSLGKDALRSAMAAAAQKRLQASTVLSGGGSRLGGAGGAASMPLSAAARRSLFAAAAERRRADDASCANGWGARAPGAAGGSAGSAASAAFGGSRGGGGKSGAAAAPGVRAATFAPRPKPPTLEIEVIVIDDDGEEVVVEVEGPNTQAQQGPGLEEGEGEDTGPSRRSGTGAATASSSASAVASKAAYPSGLDDDDEGGGDSDSSIEIVEASMPRPLVSAAVAAAVSAPASRKLTASGAAPAAAFLAASGSAVSSSAGGSARKLASAAPSYASLSTAARPPYAGAYAQAYQCGACTYRGGYPTVTMPGAGAGGGSGGGGASLGRGRAGAVILLGCEVCGAPVGELPA